MLEDAGATLLENPFEPPGDQRVDQTYIEPRNGTVTRELCAGFVLAQLGRYVRQDEFFKNPGTVVELEAPEKLHSGIIYFDGAWVVGPESTRHGRETTGYENVLSLVYSARSLNAVLTSESGQPYTVQVTLNGEFLTPENKGQDITIAANGESFLAVDEPRMYNVVEAPAYAKDNALTLSSNSVDFGIFAFTFGVYQTGP